MHLPSDAVCLCVAGARPSTRTTRWLAHRAHRAQAEHVARHSQRVLHLTAQHGHDSKHAMVAVAQRTCTACSQTNRAQSSRRLTFRCADTASTRWSRVRTCIDMNQLSCVLIVRTGPELWRRCVSRPSPKVGSCRAGTAPHREEQLAVGVKVTECLVSGRLRKTDPDKHTPAADLRHKGMVEPHAWWTLMPSGEKKRPVVKRAELWPQENICLAYPIGRVASSAYGLQASVNEGAVRCLQQRRLPTPARPSLDGAREAPLLRLRAVYSSCSQCTRGRPSPASERRQDASMSAFARLQL